MFKKYIPIVIPLLVLIFFIGKYIYMMPKFDEGVFAPDFEAQTLSGEPFTLSNLQGNYVLLDFWGTWCGPCMQEMPNLKKLHQKHYGKKFKSADNFEIVSIALEKAGTESRWEKTIKRKELVWTHHIFDAVTNFRFLDAPIASQIYGVKEVPTKYFIDPKGQVLGVNLPFEEIDQILMADQ